MLSVVASPHARRSRRFSLTETLWRCVVCARETGQRGHPMKKTYEKPVLLKRQKLSSVVAVASNVSV
jgi:hypothetical protein